MVTSGIVLAREGSQFRVRTEQGDVTATIRGRVKRHDDRALPGDHVQLEQSATGWAIASVEPRRNALARREPGRRKERPLAANLEEVFVMTATRDPDPVLQLLDRLLVLAEVDDIPAAVIVNKIDKDPGTALLERMRRVAEDNMRHTASRAFDYSSNLFSELPPPGGFPGTRLNVFFGNINQSAWVYDPLYESYLRYVDTADPSDKGLLHPEIDRLTGRQLHFENVVVIMADIGRGTAGGAAVPGGDHDGHDRGRCPRDRGRSPGIGRVVAGGGRRSASLQAYQGRSRTDAARRPDHCEWAAARGTVR